MVIVSRSWWLLKEKLSFFATENEIRELVGELSWNEVARIRYTPADISRHEKMVYKGTLSTWCIDLTKDIDQIFREMKKTTRREIRRVEEMLDDIKIYMNGETARKDFFTIYNNFVKQRGHTYRLSLSRYKQYLEVGDVFVLYFKGKPYAASLDMPDYATKRVYGVFLGSNRLVNDEDQQYSSYLNRYLYWHEMQTYKEKGFEIYDFGGGGEQIGSRSWFKKSFGGSALKEHHYVFAGSVVTYILGKAVMNSLNLINKIRTMSNNLVK